MDKKYDHLIFEPQAQAMWQKNQTYAPKNNSGPLYTIDTPPPTVSGTLHIGHIFSYTQTDIIARYKRMNGFSVFYPFGFDDNGLPTERYIEKKCRVHAHELGRSKFIRLCLDETKQIEAVFTSLWQRMGLSADWHHTYSTISDSVRRLAQASFIDLYKRGFVYRKYEPALYCTTCRTSVAQAELDDVEHSSFFNNIVFKDNHDNDLIVGTTRPELLASCVALLFNPTDERYQHLKGTRASVPIFNFSVPIYEDEKVAIDKGTGLVMCCTFGDKTDIEWYKKFKLPYKKSIGSDGRLTQEAGILAGLKVKEARARIIEELIKTNLLISQREITHVVNVHERCGKEIEFIALEQWFISILEHKKKFLELGDQISWYPSFMKARYSDWVENLGWDWCISRQRFYGIAFPVWHCNDCGGIIVAETKNLPIDPQETEPSKPCPECSSSNIRADTDVMDTWNTSALTPYICYELFKQQSFSITDDHVKEFIPMNIRPQAHDIIRTWAFYSITRTWMHHNTIPWKTIVISGHVLSNAQTKLSKSKGSSSLSPEKLLSIYPADAIRYWTASGSLGHDVVFSEHQLKIGQRLITKLWNAFRFVHEHTNDLENPENLPENLGHVDEWLLHTVTEAFANYHDYFEAHEFGLAIGVAEKFFWHNFCDNYLEFIKNQLFNPGNYTSEQMYATHWTLYHVGLRILQLFAPYLPHLTETLYGFIYKQHSQISSLHQTRFSQIQSAYVFEQSATTISSLITLISAIRKLKTTEQLSLKTPLESLTIMSTSDGLLAALKREENLIRGVSQAKEVIYKSGSDKMKMEKKNELWHAYIAIKE